VARRFKNFDRYPYRSNDAAYFARFGVGVKPKEFDLGTDSRAMAHRALEPLPHQIRSQLLSASLQVVNHRRRDLADDTILECLLESFHKCRVCICVCSGFAFGLFAGHPKIHRPRNRCRALPGDFPRSPEVAACTFKKQQRNRMPRQSETTRSCARVIISRRQSYQGKGSRKLY
jgi:hypothetical protein